MVFIFRVSAAKIQERLLMYQTHWNQKSDLSEAIQERVPLSEMTSINLLSNADFHLIIQWVILMTPQITKVRLN